MLSDDIEELLDVRDELVSAKMRGNLRDIESCEERLVWIRNRINEYEQED